MTIKINPYTYSDKSKNLTFGENPPIVRLGYDDAISAEKRALIRRHIIDTIRPYADIYERSPRLTEYQMEAMLKPLLNPKIESIGNCSYRGPQLDWRLQKFKEAGIQCVIDLDGNSEYEKQIEKADLEYMSCWDITNWKNNAYMSFDKYKKSKYWQENGSLDIKTLKNNFNEECRPFIDKLIKFVQRMQKGYCYIGCDFGTYRTNDALRIYKVFSPTPVPFDVPQIGFQDNFKFDSIRNLYDKLTVEDKKALGWNNELIEQINHDNIVGRIWRRSAKVLK